MFLACSIIFHEYNVVNKLPSEWWTMLPPTLPLEINICFLNSYWHNLRLKFSSFQVEDLSFPFNVEGHEIVCSEPKPYSSWVKKAVVDFFFSGKRDKLRT